MKTPTAVIPGAEAVFHINDHAPGVLLLHGFSGSPGEMSYPGEMIIRNGYSVSIPRYPGHGTSLEEMAATTPEQWYGAAREAYLELSRRAPRIIIVGLSMGGLFALRLAHEFKTEQIALLSTPAGVSDWRLYTLGFLGLFKKFIWEESADRGVNDPEIRKNHICYHQGLAVRPAWKTYKFMRDTMKLLPEIESQALIMQGDHDKVIPSYSADRLETRLGSKDVEIFRAPRSNHAISVDFDRKEVAQKLIEFLKIPEDNTF